MEFVTATYRLRCQEAEAASFAQQIALEQTVEVPEELLDSARIRDEIVGRVRSILPDPLLEDRFRAVIDFPVDVAGPHVGQMWNLLFGNISLKRHVKLIDVQLPPSLASALPGPKYGIPGLRTWLGVHGRPLLATALKPRGSSAEQLAELAYEFALGNGDFVKDDHNLVDRNFDEFRRRVDLCQSAVEKAVVETGRSCIYAPNLSPPARDLERYCEFLNQRGIRAALIAPMILGLESVRELAASTPLFLMAHPTFSGSFFHDPDHGVDPGVLLGQWFRLIGCDATIFPNHGGRFTFSRDECRSIAVAAMQAADNRRPCWPAPAGGMSFERLAEMAREYGADAMFLIGGALLADSRNLRHSTRRFAEQVAAMFPEHRQSTPQRPTFASACELPVPQNVRTEIRERLEFQAGFRWDGRSPVAYKVNGELPFEGVIRTELIGAHGEQTAFDVRYFEIAPGGFSSREKHVHTHVIIGVRGRGRLAIGERDIDVAPFDIAYVPPLSVHQLQNRSAEPFGFLCIVDHDRDRPMPP